MPETPTACPRCGAGPYPCRIECMTGACTPKERTVNVAAEPLTTDDLRARIDRREGPRRDVDQRLHLATQLTLHRARAVVEAHAAISGEAVGDHRLRTELRELATMISALDDALAAVDAR